MLTLIAGIDDAMGTSEGAVFRQQEEGTEPNIAYRPSPRHLDLDHVLAVRYLRRVGADNTVRLGQHRLQLLPFRDRQHFATCQVEIAEHLDGKLTVHYQGVLIGSADAPEEAPLLRARGGPRPSS